MLSPPDSAIEGASDDVPEVRVRVLPLDAELTVQPGESMMSAAQRQGYFWPTRCRGQALCTACLFEVVSGDESFDEIEPLEREALESLSGERPERDPHHPRNPPLGGRVRHGGRTHAHGPRRRHTRLTTPVRTESR
jgi:ferredoxin